MLKKLGSDLLYLVLYSVKRYGTGYVLHPDHLGYIIDRIEEAADEEVGEVISELLVELEEGDYISDTFLDNLKDYFEDAGDDTYESTLYEIIEKSYLSVKDRIPA